MKPPRTYHGSLNHIAKQMVEDEFKRPNESLLQLSFLSAAFAVGVTVFRFKPGKVIDDFNIKCDRWREKLKKS